MSAGTGPCVRALSAAPAPCSSRTSDLQQVLAERDGDGFGAVRGAELLEDDLGVFLDAVDADGPAVEFPGFDIVAPEASSTLMSICPTGLSRRTVHSSPKDTPFRPSTNAAWVTSAAERRTAVSHRPFAGCAPCARDAKRETRRPKWRKLSERIASAIVYQKQGPTHIPRFEGALVFIHGKWHNSCVLKKATIVALRITKDA